MNRSIGCLVGLAVGDAVGTSVEFRERGTFPEVTDMTGGGPFRLKAGQWTDDTSMALCMAQSFIDKRGFDANDQMDKYVKWYKSGYMSSTGTCFDIGNATRTALEKYISTGNPFSGDTNHFSSGNGGLMRMAPVLIYFRNANTTTLNYHATRSSKTTHASYDCLKATELFARIVQQCLKLGNNGPKPQIDSDLVNLNKTYEELNGSGYVINSLETALWCFQNTDSFKEAILKCVNVGDDSDTTAAICGQIAGAYYGIEGIPSDWLGKLQDYDMIVDMARKLHR